jgi:DNA-directed RNA polymerase subunit E'/Rpb7
MSLQKFFYSKVIQQKELICPNELVNDIDTVILDKIKKNIGNKCSKEGYIDKDSIEIVERSIGKINTSHFSGNIEYNIKIKANTCNPLEGDVIRCKVLGKNKIGILCKNEPLLIALSKVHHEDNLSIFENIQINDTIDVKVICSKFEYNDTEIHVIGKIQL